MDWLSFLSGGFVTAFVTVLIEKVFDLWRDYSTRKAEAERHDEEQAEAYEAEYLSEKKKAYLEVLQWLAEIRHGFDVTRSPMGRLDSAIQKRIEKLNDNMPLLSARLRLYSSDEIYNLYWQLAHYAIFAYSPSNGPHIAGSAKDLFSHSITVLARMMQDDLGLDRKSVV